MSGVTAASPATLDGSNDDKLRGSEKQRSSYNKMFYIGRELCFLLLIVFTTYASFNSSINSGAGPPPTPFFSRGSLVGDFYKGELADALLRASEGDVSFIMYYAPWDAESQATRIHMEAVAHQHYKQVYFAGINCWYAGGDCKRTLSKIQQFPKLVVYVTHETGVEYRGPRIARYMSAFLDGVIRPLYRLTNMADLISLRSSHNAVVVAYLNFKGILGGPPYRAMYETALKFLELDVRQEVAFAVVTSFRTTLEMGGNRTPCIKLYLWNETLDYAGQFTADALSNWVSSRLHQVSLWVSPPGVKSLALAPYVNHGPALIMFTPYNNFVMYDLLREVGLEYYNCNNNTEVTELAQNVSQYVSEKMSRMKRAMLSCQSRGYDTVQIVNNFWTNSSCSKWRDTSRQCLSHIPQCITQVPRSTLTLSEDPLTSSALTQWAWQESCRRMVPPPPRLPPTAIDPGLRGLACRLNRSVSLLAMDTHLFAHFATGLGVDTDQARDNTVVLLLNAQMETTHVLESPITRSSLSQFLVNFTEGRLDRFQRSRHNFSTEPASPSPNTVSVTELTTETFMPTVFNDTMNVVVLFYTPYCAFCHALSHVYLTTIRLLRSVPTLLFTRIDGENNDLPWQFTAPHYPSILFFPARRKAESRVLINRVGITVDTLSQFVLANLPLELRLLAMVQLCQRFPEAQLSARRRECLVDVRKEILEAISNHLHRYRTLSVHSLPSKEKNEAMRSLLSKLQHLKQLQFSLSVDSSRISQLTNQVLPMLVEQESTRVRDEL